MAQFKAFLNNSEVLGQALMTFIKSTGAFEQKMLKMMAENGIKEIHEQEWYPQQILLDICKTIYETIGPNTLFQMGKHVPEHAVFPPGIDSLGKALPSIDVAYHMNNRGTNIGYYKFKRTGEKEAFMICNNPYPCDFDIGIISGMTDKFKPKGCYHKAQITHDNRSCRKKGDDSCTYIISW